MAKGSGQKRKVLLLERLLRPALRALMPDVQGKAARRRPQALQGAGRHFGRKRDE